MRPRLVEFTARMLEGAVARSDQRVKGELYVRGLLTDGARKSMQQIDVITPKNRLPARSGPRA